MILYIFMAFTPGISINVMSVDAYTHRCTGRQISKIITSPILQMQKLRHGGKERCSEGNGYGTEAKSTSAGTP